MYIAHFDQLVKLSFKVPLVPENRVFMWISPIIINYLVGGKDSVGIKTGYLIAG